MQESSSAYYGISLPFEKQEVSLEAGSCGSYGNTIWNLKLSLESQDLGRKTENLKVVFIG